MKLRLAAFRHALSVAANPERWFRRPQADGRLNTWAGVLVKTARRLLHRGYWHARRKVLRGLTLPKAAGACGAVWAVSMVKDEADIIEATLRHLVSQGVDHILVVDNNSKDGTIELLHRLSAELPLHVGVDSEIGYYQDHKMTALAKFARQHGALWVIPFDADEFWFARNHSLRDFLLSTDADVVTARLFNVFPTPERPVLSGIAGKLDLDMSSPIHEKVAVRAHPLLWITMGNHFAVRPGRQTDGLRIVHVPWRSREQMVRKIRQGAEALRNTELADGFGDHWTRSDESERAGLDHLWESMLNRTAPESLGWRPQGPFVRCEIDDWRTWDPDNVIIEATRRHTSRTKSTASVSGK